MINAIIVEDELIQIAYLQNLLHDFCPEIKVIETIHSASEVIQKLSKSSFELLFLDVKLGDKNSFELLEQLPEINFQIIITSAFEQFALRAFKTNAIDYLVKPFGGNELRIAVNKVLERIQGQKKNVPGPIDGKHSNDQAICISEHETFTFIPAQSILYCRSEGNYTHVFFTNERGESETILATKNLMHFEKKLSFSNFIRIHQSFLVNKSKIRKIQKGSRELILSDGTVLEIARDRKRAVLSSLID